MSRVGKYPVEIPQGVQVAIAGGMLTAKGQLGELKLKLTEHVEATVEDGNHVVVQPHSEERQSRMMWGTTRALIANMVKGVSAGYTKSMEITGTGYRAAVQGKNLEINLGFLAPGGLSGAGRHQDHLRAADGDQGRGRGQASGRPGGGGDPRRSVRPSRTRARACAIATSRSAARKARRSDDGVASSWPAKAGHPRLAVVRAIKTWMAGPSPAMTLRLKERHARMSTLAGPAGAAARAPALPVAAQVGRTAAAVGVPLRQEHLCAGDRRQRRAARWRRRRRSTRRCARA